MSVTTTSRTRRIIQRITAAWSEMDYAQRRLVELQSGTAGVPRADRRA